MRVLACAGQGALAAANCKRRCSTSAGARTCSAPGRYVLVAARMAITRRAAACHACCAAAERAAAAAVPGLLLLARALLKERCRLRPSVATSPGALCVRSQVGSSGWRREGEPGLPGTPSASMCAGLPGCCCCC